MWTCWDVLIRLANVVVEVFEVGSGHGKFKRSDCFRATMRCRHVLKSINGPMNAEGVGLR